VYRVVERGSRLYPGALENLHDPPSRLFARGSLSHVDPPIVSIVGTRDATLYGLRMARTLASAFARSGVSVVSGMARGIDSAVHRAALESGGRTVAVLGTGIDVPYPVGHRELHRVLSERALVISEHGPGTPARAGAFPRRNRIIAALSPVTIVVEAGHRSGAINTANQATALQRTLGAVPGPVDSPQSAGTNQLIRDGAQVISCVADALALVGIGSPEENPPAHLAAAEGRAWKALAGGPLPPDELAQRSSMTTRECLECVTSLELLGLVECLVTGEVRRR
jgi:DNA processing protein